MAKTAEQQQQLQVCIARKEMVMITKIVTGYHHF